MFILVGYFFGKAAVGREETGQSISLLQLPLRGK